MNEICCRIFDCRARATSNHFREVPERAAESGYSRAKLPSRTVLGLDAAAGTCATAERANRQDRVCFKVRIFVLAADRTGRQRDESRYSTHANGSEMEQSRTIIVAAVLRSRRRCSWFHSWRALLVQDL